jgi:hypothetical protein
MRPSRRALVASVLAVVAAGLVGLGAPPPGAAAISPDRPAIADPDRPAVRAAAWRAYRAAIVDSTVATPDEVVDDLLVPTPADTRTRWRAIDGEDYLLVGTLRHEPFPGVAAGEAFTVPTDEWVSIPGELGQECRRYRCRAVNATRLDRTLKQVLGLPPDGDYGYVMEYWVKPADLFRPCTDPRITSSSCPAEVASGTATMPVPALVGGTDLNSFLWSQANYAWRMPSRFRPKAAVSCARDWTARSCYGFPWTRLGYTYDWTPGAEDHVGVTEFVVAKGATGYLERVGSQRDFFPRR